MTRLSYILSFFLMLSFLYQHNIQGQNIFENQKKVTRVLFMLDGSGSMMDKWQSSTRFHIAKKLLSNVIDSIEKSNSKVEFALRVFGHQHPKRLNDCKDSKLEVPFRKYNAKNLKNKLDQITPQGWTPIAYSLFLSMDDFPTDPYAINAIVLITDGIENCEGDPCAVGLELQKRHITLKPFIIGLGLEEDKKISFDCVGTYFDAASKKTFENTLNIVISQALNTTSSQVNLLDLYHNPTETNVEMTFYDAFSGEVRYNFLHTMNDQGTPDTLFLNPAGKYNLVVHSIPSVEKKNIELVPGKHNIIAVDVPQGSLKIRIEKMMNYKSIQSIIRQSGNKQTFMVQDVNVEKKYLVSSYDIEILTTPRILHKNISIEQSKVTEIKIPMPGNLYIYSNNPGIGSIYMIKNGRYIKVYEFAEINTRAILSIQPGDYLFVYRPKKAYDTELTQEQKFTIYPMRTTNLQF